MKPSMRHWQSESSRCQCQEQDFQQKMTLIFKMFRQFRGTAVAQRQNGENEKINEI
jgi:hypothetical protein